MSKAKLKRVISTETAENKAEQAQATEAERMIQEREYARYRHRVRTRPGELHVPTRIVYWYYIVGTPVRIDNIVKSSGWLWSYSSQGRGIVIHEEPQGFEHVRIERAKAINWNTTFDGSPYWWRREVNSVTYKREGSEGKTKLVRRQPPMVEVTVLELSDPELGLFRHLQNTLSKRSRRAWELRERTGRCVIVDGGRRYGYVEREGEVYLVEMASEQVEGNE